MLTQPQECRPPSRGPDPSPTFCVEVNHRGEAEADKTPGTKKTHRELTGPSPIPVQGLPSRPSPWGAALSCVVRP